MAKLILTPFTKISTYDNLSRNSNTTILGSIGYTISEDKKVRDEFYKSKIGRKNIQIISELVSELYTFINRNLSKYSDPESYWFRVYYTIEVNDSNGEIINKPSFDVDLYKHVGKIAGRSSLEESNNVRVILADLATPKLAKYFNFGIRLVKNNVPLVDYDTYKKYHEIPQKYRDVINDERSYIITNEKIYEIKYSVVDNIITYHVDKNEESISLNDQMDVFNFILSEIELDPEIMTHSTVFKYSDEEIRGMEKNVKENYSITIDDEYKNDIETIMIIDDMIKKIEPIMEKLNARKRMKKDYRDSLEKVIKRYVNIKSNFDEYRISFFSHKELLSDLSSKFDAGLISNDDYTSHKLKSLNNINRAKVELSNINNIMIREIDPKFKELERLIFKKKVDKK